jgi:hypothetical protein
MPDETLFAQYRTFHTVGTGTANLGVYCLLADLERRLELDGYLPPTFFFQLDGGPENANTTFFAMIELLVAKRIIKNKIYVTRLPVGHTHEDIDAVFALIWDTIKCTHALTPQQYRQMILK